MTRRIPSWHCHWFPCFLLCCALFLIGDISPLQAEQASQEYQLKAAFLVNFARFIVWPQEAFPAGQQDLIFCVAGKNPFGTTLRAIESKNINGRGIKVLETDAMQTLSQCHLLYVSDKNQWESVTKSISGISVVTVSDLPGFVDAGGSIEFVTRDNRLSFVINNTALKQRGIQASASMLDLAASVR